MSKHTQGQIGTYFPNNGRLIGAPGSPWTSGRVRLIGDEVNNVCDPRAGTFDVTVSPATAAQLTTNPSFDLVYDDSDTGQFKSVEVFAGEVLTSSVARRKLA